MKNTLGIEVCSCNQALFYRAALRYIQRVATIDTRQSQWDDLLDIQRRALATLDAREPGGEPPCSCDEAEHLKRALRACVNVARDGEGGKIDQPIDDVAQCNNFAYQGLNLLPIEGDPGVYNCIPGTIENARWSLGKQGVNRNAWGGQTSWLKVPKQGGK